jgi:hypothetical protein
VRRYVQGDPYKENYLECDIRVTTVLSGGTAHDVKNLIEYSIQLMQNNKAMKKKFMNLMTLQLKQDIVMHVQVVTNG